MNSSVFMPSCELTFDTVQADRNRLLKHIKNDKLVFLCFDLSQVKHCDSAGLALLIEAKRLCQQHNKPFQIENMPATVQALAEFCGVESLLSMSI